MVGRQVVWFCIFAWCGIGTAHSDAAYEACMKTAMTNSDFDECGGAYVKRADAALNEAWKQTYAEASDEMAKALLEEQHAWLVYRDRSCLFYMAPGSGRENQVINFPSCRAEVIVDRTKELTAIGKELASH